MSTELTMSGLYGTSALPSLMTPFITNAFIGQTTIGWRGAYWLMCAWHGLAGIFLFCFYRPPSYNTKHREDRQSKWQLIREMDYVGLFLFTAGCILFLFGVNAGGKTYPWRSAAVIAPIIAGFLLLVSVFVWDFNANLKYPLFPPKIFKNWRG